MNDFTRRIRPHVQAELLASSVLEARDEDALAFACLKRACVLRQAHDRAWARPLAHADVGSEAP